MRFARFEPTSYDNAIFEQAIRGYAHLQAPIVPIKGPGFNLLGDHFSPIIALAAPVYRLFPEAQTLMVVQAVLIASRCTSSTSLGLRRLGWWAGGGIALAYGLSFGLQSAVASNFHEVAFGAPLLALAGAAYVERRYGHVVAWSLPLLLVKEDLGLTVALIGLVLWLAGERRRGLWLAIAGGVGFLLVLLVIIPAFNPDGAYAYTGTVGGDRGLLATVLDDSGRKLLTVVMTFAVGGLAALASPWALLVLPTFAWRFAGDNPYYWGTDFHYSILLMVIVAVAAIDAMARHPWLRPLAAVAVAFTVAMQFGSPLASLADPDTYDHAQRTDAAEHVLTLDPRRRERRHRHRAHDAPGRRPRRHLDRHPGQRDPGLGRCSTSAPVSARRPTRSRTPRSATRCRTRWSRTSTATSSPAAAAEPLARAVSSQVARVRFSHRDWDASEEVRRNARRHLSRPGRRPPSGAAVVTAKVPARESRPPRAREMTSCVVMASSEALFSRRENLTLARGEADSHERGASATGASST